MSYSLFISDLHLSTDHAHSSEAFRRFTSTLAPEVEALYILGDLFEYWAGDDDLDALFHTDVINALHGLSASGINLYLMHGNRDFLMGEKLAQAAGATLLNDPVLLDLYGTPTLLTHGDTLCTDDIEYQQFRTMVRSKKFQEEFLAQSLAERKAYIEQLRRQSNAAKQSKASEIMDVNDEAVATLLRDYNYPRLIHGHTHRPNRHEHRVDNHLCERWVLSDWDQHPTALRCDATGCSTIPV
ncbi:MAG: UDP-2,3-diacylglucosamine diphosphatase [Gallionella sp.]